MSLYEYRKEAKFLDGIEKVEKLNEGLAIAIDSYKHESIEYNRNAISWTIIDLIKYYLSIKYHGEATYFYMLLDLNKSGRRVSLLKEQMIKLRRRIDSRYRTIDKAEKLLHNRDVKESLAILRDLNKKGKLSLINHQLYAKAIYTYLEFYEQRLTIEEIKSHLREYLRLKNLRPSHLHMNFMKFAWRCSRNNENFDIERFISYCKVDTSKNPVSNYHNLLRIRTESFYKFSFLKYD